MEVQKVTSLEDLKKYAKGVYAELPEFGPDQPFYAYISRPSLLSLTANGKIPNALLGIATSLFKNGSATISSAKPEDLQKSTQVFHILAKAALVNPTYDEIKEAGLELNDEQLAFIFNYTQQGTKALETFRRQSKALKRASNGTKVQKTTVGDSKG